MIIVSSTSLSYINRITILQLIGWRDISRKLLLFITDAGFHYAGDGKVCMCVDMCYFVYVCVCVHFFIVLARN